MLEREAKSRGETVSALIRSAIEAAYGRSGSERKLAAWQELRDAVPSAIYLSPDEINQVVAEERDDWQPANGS